jgi:hypothetical protein
MQQVPQKPSEVETIMKEKEMTNIKYQEFIKCCREAVGEWLKKEANKKMGNNSVYYNSKVPGDSPTRP